MTTPLPDPELPEQASEIAALDPAYKNQIPLNPDGTEKWVTIRQEESKWPVQAPLSKESSWVISFQDNGETGETWDNPLMGWVSSADPMANNMRLQMSFDTAANAKYFCEKRGWKYMIEMPILRRGRDDSAQYQDCFLPQDVAGRVKREGKKCDQWYRDAAGASHYFRPLKYHGDGLVRQHGPNGGKPGGQGCGKLLQDEVDRCGTERWRERIIRRLGGGGCGGEYELPRCINVGSRNG